MRVRVQDVNPSINNDPRYPDKEYSDPAGCANIPTSRAVPAVGASVGKPQDMDEDIGLDALQILSALSRNSMTRLPFPRTGYRAILNSIPYPTCP